MTANYDWTRFICKINIYTSVEAVYDAWTIPNQLESWFLRDARFKRGDGSTREQELHIQTNDTYTWHWHGHTDEVEEKGKVIQANGINKLQFSFTKGAEVTVDIGVSLNETIIMLTQDKMTNDEAGKLIHVDCYGGWTFYLANLKSFLEGGIDLRNKNIDLKNMVNN